VKEYKINVSKNYVAVHVFSNSKLEYGENNFFYALKWQSAMGYGVVYVKGSSNQLSPVMATVNSCYKRLRSFGAYEIFLLCVNGYDFFQFYLIESLTPDFKQECPHCLLKKELFVHVQSITRSLTDRAI
jgi:hypothetical protein